jgi:hypothetical protein
MAAARASADPRDRLVVELLAAWTAANLEHIRHCERLVAGHRGPLDRHKIGRIVARVGRAAGVPGVHPHRLRRTLATQAINRGMRLEAIAALPGHRKMEMTLIYARIANRVAHARMPGNGLCTRPAELDCRPEPARETCACFRTGTEFPPVLPRQRDHARDHGQAGRAALPGGLIQRAETGPATTDTGRS